MSWKFNATRRDACRTLAAAAGLHDCLIGADWGTVEDGTGAAPLAFGRFVAGRFLMNEELVAGALLRLFPATSATPTMGAISVVAPPADFLQSMAAQVPEAALFFIDGPRLDHAAMTAAGATRWFTHAGQAVLRKDQLAAPMVQKLREGEQLAQLSDTWPTAEALEHLYMNYCALTGLLPRLKRTVEWWKELLKQPGIRLQSITLPTYDEEDPESLTGPAEISGYVIFRDEGSTRHCLETVVSVIDGDEDANIDLLLNDALHAIVRGAFWPAAKPDAKPGAAVTATIDRLIWHGSPGDLMWSRGSMYGCETREQTGTSYLKILKPAEIAEQLIKPMVEQDVEGDFRGEITVVLTDLEKFAYRRKGNRKEGRLTVSISTQEFVSCMLHPYRLTSLVAEEGIEFDCDNEDVDPMWAVFTSLFDVLHPHWPVLE